MPLARGKRTKSLPSAGVPWGAAGREKTLRLLCPLASMSADFELGSGLGPPRQMHEPGRPCYRHTLAGRGRRFDRFSQGLPALVLVGREWTCLEEDQAVRILAQNGIARRDRLAAADQAELPLPQDFAMLGIDGSRASKPASRPPG